MGAADMKDFYICLKGCWFDALVDIKERSVCFLCAFEWFYQFLFKTEDQ